MKFANRKLLIEKALVYSQRSSPSSVLNLWINLWCTLGKFCQDAEGHY